ncbi:hypothetical protein [Pseudomonas fulva]|uniref:hypothetical protein n=1 Tax=Pseudomonas fulva TaxID=47880 RepID=UPI000F76DB25|nr:hypothetical protein [Pseudomonas fulva]MBA1209386.1 hypothetical protein [Pseudomonas fulva]MBA1217774.1 hypothetical protein [Pseudomonas fulva]MDH0573254.1 hypothetical protein [Pseudomonas fulva]RRW56918.1 hypothetical protein EGJ51_21325 [Pseudomonas fulva]
MAYNSAHTGPEIDAAVQLLGQIQEARDSTSQDLSKVKDLASQVKVDAAQVAGQTEAVISKGSQVSQDAAVVEQARQEVVGAAATANEAMDAASLSAASALESQNAASISEQAAASSQLAAGLSEQVSAESASEAKAAADRVADDRKSAAESAASAAASAQNAEAVVTGGTASVNPGPGLIPLADAQGKIDEEWLPPTVASTESVQSTLEVAERASDAAAEAQARAASFLLPSPEAPVVRDDGAPLQIGDRYFNSVEQAEFIYKTSGWESNESIEAVREIQDDISQVSGASKIPRARLDGKLSVDWFPTEITALALRLAGVYTPQMFGVTNDGVTDFTNQIRNLHESANSAGNVRVDYHGISTLYIDAGAFITVNTDTDWAGCVFKAVNGFDDNPDFRTSTTFFADDPSVIPQALNIDPAELFKGATRITVPEDVGNGFLLIESNKPVGNRTSDPAKNLFFEQSFSIERGGILNKPLGTDLTASEVTVTFRRNPKNWIELKGIAADENTYNNQCLVKVRRNLVRQIGYVVQPNGRNTQQRNVNYLFQVTNCANVVCQDWQVSAQTSDGSTTSTYGITADRVAELTYLRLTGKGRNTWGVTLTDHVNGWYIIDCHMNRFDVHKGMHNTYVRGGSLYDYGVRYGWGTGSLVVDGVTVYGNAPVVAARTDYDGGWDGDISIVDPIQKYGKLAAGPSGVAEVNGIFACNAIGGRVPVKMCESLEILNPTFDYEGAPGILLVRPIVADVAQGNTGVQLPNRIVVDNVKCNKGKVAFSFGFPMEKFTAPSGGKCMIDISGIKGRPFPASTTLHRTAPVSSYVSPPGTFEFNLSRITGLMTYFGGPGAKINIDQSEVSGIKSFVGTGPAQSITITDSDMLETQASLGGSVVGELADASSDVVISRMTVKSQANLSFADALQGVLIKNGVTCTLPANVTPALAYAGYKSSSVYQ